MTAKYNKYTLLWKNGKILHCIATNTKDVAAYILNTTSRKNINKEIYSKAEVTKHELTDEDICNPNTVTIQDGYSNGTSPDVIALRLKAIQKEKVIVYQ